MQPPRVEHPAEFRADARLGRFELTRLIAAILVLAVGGITCLISGMMGVSGWRILLYLVITAGIVAELMWRVVRRIKRWLFYKLRPRQRGADASRMTTEASEATVQDLIRVQGCTGPFVQFLDGYVAMVLRVMPPPTSSMSPLQLETMRARWVNALKRAAEASLEVQVYVDVEPDLNRPEMERLARLAARWPKESGLRRMMEARIAHHQQLAETRCRRIATHLRLSIRAADVPVAGEGLSTAEVTEQVISYLRDMGMGIAAELNSAGCRVQPLGPDGIRDLTARQLDPAGWRAAEPPRGTDWAWPVGEEPAMLRAAATGEEVQLPYAEAPPHRVEQQQQPVSAWSPAVDAEEEEEEGLGFPPVHVAEGPVMEEPVVPAPATPAPIRQAVQAAPEAVELVVAAAVPAPEPPQGSPPSRPTPWWQSVTRRPAPQQPLQRAQEAGPMTTREVIAVVGANRRVGTSTVSISLALALRSRGNSITHISLDGGRNDVVAWTGIHALVSNHDWVQGTEDLLLPGPRGIHLVPGPTRLPGATYQMMDNDTITRLLGRIRRESDVVVLDLGAEITSEQRAILMQATGVIVVTTPDLDEESAQMVVEMAAAQGIPRNHVAVFLNRAPSGRAPAHSGPVELILPDEPLLPECRRVGSLPVVAAPDSQWVQTLMSWSQRL